MINKHAIIFDLQPARVFLHLLSMFETLLPAFKFQTKHLAFML